MREGNKKERNREREIWRGIENGKNAYRKGKGGKKKRVDG